MSDQPVESQNVKRLTDILGYDPLKRVSLPGNLFEEIVKEIKDEEVAAARVKAKEFLLKAMSLRKEMDKVRREAENQFRRFDKDLGKIINQINSITSGNPVEEEKPEAEPA